MKSFLYLILFVVIITGCSDDDAPNIILNDCDFETLMSAEEFVSAPSNAVSIDELTIDGDCLTIRFSASGCDGSTWNVMLIDSESVFESAPPQRNLRLSLENLEDCLAIVSMELSFNITDLQVDGNDSVRLNITNSDESILYSY